MVKYCTVFFLLLTIIIHAEINDEIENIIFSNNVTITDSTKNTTKTIVTSELQILGLNLIKLYQKIISSQQDSDNVCTFTPSCSHYATTAIKKYGILKGGLMTSDRLQRCHFINESYYSRNPVTGKLIDKVDSRNYED